MTRIRESEIKADLFALAGDEMRGREGGTLDEMNASVWMAERARQAGLQPAGDNGTYFQFFPLERFRVSASSVVSLGGKALRMGRDVVPDNTVLAVVDASVVIVTNETLATADVTGKTVVMRYVPVPLPGPRLSRRAAPARPAPVAVALGGDRRHGARGGLCTRAADRGTEPDVFAL